MELRFLFIKNLESAVIFRIYYHNAKIKIINIRVNYEDRDKDFLQYLQDQERVAYSPSSFLLSW